MSPAPAVELTGLEKRYGTRVALAGIDLRIEVGEIFGLLGPNGAGKTTTVEILEGYRDADAGTVRVLGHDPRRDAPMLRPLVGVMLQEGGLYPGLRPLELLRLYAAFYDDADDPDRLLDLVGLRDAADTMIRRLSGGQAQRLSLAAAVIGRPRLVFLDEPTAGMDPRARADTWELVRDLRDAGTTVVLTTHYMNEAEALCDRLAILDRGRIVADGSPTEVTSGAGEPTVRFRCAAEIDAAALALALDATVVADRGVGAYRVTTTPTPALVATLTAWLRDVDVQLVELRTGSVSLEEGFLRLTEEPEVAAGPHGRTRSSR
ncbi:MAG: ABC transporter ATP-binding protein [Acidimicrobiia bacterium]